MPDLFTFGEPVEVICPILATDPGSILVQLVLLVFITRGRVGTFTIAGPLNAVRSTLAVSTVRYGLTGIFAL